MDLKVCCKMFFISVILYCLDMILSAKLVSAIIDSYIILMLTLFSVFVALYVFISPLLYQLSGITKEIDNKVIDKTFVLVLKGINEAKFFFILGIIIYIPFTSDHLVNKYVKHILECLLLFCLVMVCQNITDHTQMTRTLTHGLFKLNKDK